MATCERIYSGSYAASVRTAPCERTAGHPGFCRFPVLPQEVVRETVLVLGVLLLLALGLLGDGLFAWGMP